MKISTKFLIPIFVIAYFILPSESSAQFFCKANGNVIIYSNYDGGYLNINVDENIPNLKIGITTYEDCEINITGTYASNVTQVIYAGYQGDNQHCNPSPLTTSVLGVPSNIVTVLLYPAATLNNPFGYPFIICNYSCDSFSYQGGCNTPDQISHYYLTEFGGLLYYHFTQYGCWNGTYDVSSGGNCCIGEDILPPQYNITAGFTASSDTVCAEQGIIFTNTSFNTYPGSPQYNWDFGDGSPDGTSANASHGYNVPGNYTVTLTISDSTGLATDTQSIVITVLDCGATGIDNAAGNVISIYPNPAQDELTCWLPKQFPFPAVVQLIDAMGSIRIQSVVNQVPSNNKVVLNVRDLPSGIYLLRIKGGEQQTERKVLVD